MEPSKNLVKSADRVLDVLETLAGRSRGLTHTELSTELDIPKSSLSKLIGNLTERGYLKFVPGPNVYEIGAGLLLLLNRQKFNREVPGHAQQVCERLTRQTQESSSFNVQEGRLATRICGANSQQPLTFMMNVGQSAPLHSVSSGKIMLAWQTALQIEDYLANVDFEPITPKTLTDKMRLMEQLKSVRENEVAWSEEEYTVGIVGVAVPVLNGSTKLIGALNIAFPAVRDSAAQREKMVKVLREAAASLHNNLKSAELS